jgi:TolB-like protein/Flp pilus assembly protein TadD
MANPAGRMRPAPAFHAPSHDLARHLLDYGRDIHFFIGYFSSISNGMTQDSTNQTTVGRDVFVSYASQDAAVADSIVESLEAHGLKCWMAPRDVKPGAQYADAIVRAINEAKAVVMVMSGSAVGSSHVGKEIERASSKRKPIIAFRIDAAPLNHALEYFLSESQWIDAKALGMPAALNKLKEAVGQGSKASSPEVTASRNIGGPKKRIVIAATAVVIALGIAVGLGVYFWSSKHVTQAPSVAAITDKSIAVLPFVDMSEKKDQEYFSDGLSEELIDMLTKVPELKVPARTSSFYFKGKQVTIAEIAKALGVANVLEGSVRKSGNKLRITAQLIRVDNGYHLWSETYDRNNGDIFQIQDDISNAVVSALKVSLGALAPPRTTPNKDAYDLYLLAQSSYGQANSKEDYQKIVEELKEAIRLDPSFSRAWAFLSSTFSTLAGYQYIDPTRGFNDARSAAIKAIELNPNASEGHRALAKVLYLHDWEWRQAEGEVNAARSLAPEDPANLTFASIIAGILGNANVAVRFITQAVEKDPLSSDRWDQLGQDQMRAGNFDDAVAAFRRAQALRPSYSNAHWNLGTALLLRGKAADALAEFEREPEEEDRIAGRALAYYTMGRTADADAALRKSEPLLIRFGGYTLAQLYAFRGERDQAFAWLARSYQQRETDCGAMKLDPLLKNLRSDPRYKAFLKKMNLPE